MFAVTAGLGVEKKEKYFIDDARRLLGDHAESAGRPPGRSLCRGHARARAHRLWGYEPRSLSNEELIDEKYLGIRRRPATRPAPTTASRRDVQDAAGRGDRHGADRELRDVAGRGGVGFYFCAPGVEVLQGREDRAGPAGGHGGAPWVPAKRISSACWRRTSEPSVPRRRESIKSYSREGGNPSRHSREGVHPSFVSRTLEKRVYPASGGRLTRLNFHTQRQTPAKTPAPPSPARPLPDPARAT